MFQVSADVLQRSIEPMQILLVEDNPGDVRLARSALAACELFHVLHVVVKGEQALQYLFHEGQFGHSVKPHIVLLDLGLPKVDGLSVLKGIRAHDDLRELPVVVLTGSAVEGETLTAFGVPAKYYMPKPVDFDKLFHLVMTIEELW